MTARWRNDIVVGHFVRSDTSHVMQAIDVTRHSKITQQLFHLPPHSPSSAVPSSHAKKKLLMTFGTTLIDTVVQEVQPYTPHPSLLPSDGKKYICLCRPILLMLSIFVFLFQTYQSLIPLSVSLSSPAVIMSFTLQY